MPVRRVVRLSMFANTCITCTMAHAWLAFNWFISSPAPRGSHMLNVHRCFHVSALVPNVFHSPLGTRRCPPVLSVRFPALRLDIGAPRAPTTFARFRLARTRSVTEGGGGNLCESEGLHSGPFCTSPTPHSSWGGGRSFLHLSHPTAAGGGQSDCESPLCTSSLSLSLSHLAPRTHACS